MEENESLKVVFLFTSMVALLLIGASFGAYIAGSSYEQVKNQQTKEDTFYKWSDRCEIKEQQLVYEKYNRDSSIKVTVN